MSRQPEARVVSASPLGANWRELDTADLTFVVENGEHLHVLISRDGLESLNRHIQQLRSQTLFQPGPPPES